MASTTINFRIDEDTKHDLETVCKNLGMNTTTAFTIFAKKVVRENRIPFEVSVDPFYSEENIAHLKRSIEALNAGRGEIHELVVNE